MREKGYSLPQIPSSIVLEYIPAPFQDWCLHLWKMHPFHLRLARPRRSKTGDYRFIPPGSHVITINRDLNQWAFLITYLHEIAHQHTRIRFPDSKKHHGKEWKFVFRQLLIKMLSCDSCPSELERALASYARNPKASSYTDPSLARALANLDDQPGDSFLSELTTGDSFYFRNIRYRFLGFRRTRALVLHEENRKKYLISGHAKVRPCN